MRHNRRILVDSELGGQIRYEQRRLRNQVVWVCSDDVRICQTKFNESWSRNWESFRAFFFDFDGIKNLFYTRGKRNFTEPHLGGKSPWTGVDSNTEANVFSTVIELPTSELNPKPKIHIWGDVWR